MICVLVQMTQYYEVLFGLQYYYEVFSTAFLFLIVSNSWIDHVHAKIYGNPYIVTTPYVWVILFWVDHTHLTLT